MRCSDTYRPLKLGSIRTKIHDSTTLIHIDTGSHIRIAVPEQLLVRTVKDISPKRAFRLIVITGIDTFLLSVIIRKLRHCHINKLAFFFQITVIFTTITVGFIKKLIRLLPAPHLVHPAGSYEHHIVSIAVVIFLKITVLVDQIV